MKTRYMASVLAVLLGAAPAMGGGIVTLQLTSPDDGGGFPGSGGHTVQWSVTATVSSGDNMGLAAISFDFVQDPYNPAPIVLTPAAQVPSGMQGFERPAGISNPTAGYRGTQVPYWFGARNIAQIGGAQNTYGQPVGGMGTDVLVDPNIGQYPGGQLLGSGSFQLPAAPGIYRFMIENAAGSALIQVNDLPDWTPVAAAAVQLSDSEIELARCLAADADGDLAVTFADVTVFVDLLLNGGGVDLYTRCATDLNQDGFLDGADIQSFVDAMIAG